MELAPLTPAEVEHILSWRYPGELSTYDFDGSEAAAMLDASNRYHGIHHGGKCVGYVCLGAEARVPGLEAADGVEDFGMGLAPEMVGRGMSRWLLPALIDELTSTGVLSGHTIRAVILDWNERSQRAALAVGFAPIDTIESTAGTFVVMTRALS